MEQKLYKLNYSQEVIRLQTKYALFKRVQNILYFMTVNDSLDRETMTKAIELLYERNDSLRIRFVKKNGETFQVFEEKRTPGKIPFYDFKTQSEFEKFMNKFRKKSTNCFKGDVLRVIYAKNPDRKDIIIFKISHYVADLYGIGILMNDLFAVYNALRSGAELPKLPGKFEDVIINDTAFTDNDTAVARDMEFFTDYFTNKHPEHATYCGIHGNSSDRWLKYKNKGYFHLPYLFVKCDTEGYRFCLPADIVTKVKAWCESTGIPMSTFFLYTYSISASIVNDREKFQIPLELLNCRATLAERRSAGTKVQAISLFTTVDYEKSFNENVTEILNEQMLLYKHTKLPYVDIEKLHHGIWNFPMTGQITNFCYSFLPFKVPEGVSMQVYSNGKGALVDYVAFIYDIDSNTVSVDHDIQTRMVSPKALCDFHNVLLRVIEAVLEKPTAKLGDIL